MEAEIRLAVYRFFARAGRAPAVEELARDLGVGRSEVERALSRLQTAHALALAPTTSNIWMAHPFSGVPTAFAVESPAVTYWANCAWDAVAIPSLLELDATVAARCADCGDVTRLRFERGSLIEGDGLVHFAVPPRRFWDNVGFT